MRKQVLGAYYSAFSAILKFSLHVFDWGCCARARGSYQSKVCTCRHRNKVIKGPQETHGTGKPQTRRDRNGHISYVAQSDARAIFLPEKNQMCARVLLETGSIDRARVSVRQLRRHRSRPTGVVNGTTTHHKYVACKTCACSGAHKLSDTAWSLVHLIVRPLPRWIG
jgi:hypothetical protein